MRTRFVRDTVGEETDTIAGGRTLHTWDDLLSLTRRRSASRRGIRTRPGWCQVAAARGRGVTVYATLLGSPTRSERNVDLESLLIWGLGQFRVVPAVQTGRTYAEARFLTAGRHSGSSPRSRCSRSPASAARLRKRSPRGPSSRSRCTRVRCSAGWRSGRVGESSGRAISLLPAPLTSRVGRDG